MFSVILHPCLIEDASLEDKWLEYENHILLFFEYLYNFILCINDHLIFVDKVINIY